MKALRRYIRLYLRDRDVRTNVALFFGMLLGGIYTIFNLVVGIIYSNAWFITVGAYYTLMVAVRYITIEEGGEETSPDTASQSPLLFITSIPLIGMVIYSVVSERNGDYPMPVLIFFGVYASYGVVRFILDLYNRRKNKDTDLQADSVGHTSAALALFNLVTALTAKIDIKPVLRTGLNFITGAAVCILVLYLAMRSVSNDSENNTDK